MTKSKVKYIEGCPYCGGHIMSIYVGRKRMSSACIKCKKDTPKYVVEPRPVCIEEKVGRLMYIQEKKDKIACQKYKSW